ncbi:MAG: TIGR04283 family arsenosugar biosynthesis glycosyltransferase [Desulfurivibrionaceae bacterium]|nr:TIGR04283 family arsenosugar biosynthesis glycosyltransferase [Desulfobulbales bacterium]MDT8335855.1 TIGR04283 family arsenosugar biosynthesis glycosyltransferase [Desulfurivibrionaceae bacterium]
MSTVPKTSKISVIIPTLNEADNLRATLESLRPGRDLEIIVADGGSSDATVRIAEQGGAKVVTSRPGRSFQQNAGAAAAAGGILLFLHADTRLAADFAGAIRACLNEKGVAAGAFSLSVEMAGPAIRFIEIMANLRSRLLQQPYGDQGLFMTRENFTTSGGFPEIEIMEDFVLVGKLRNLGRIKTLPAVAVTSGRRWQKLGIARTTLINQAIVIGYLFGRSPTSLASWYRISSRAR